MPRLAFVLAVSLLIFLGCAESTRSGRDSAVRTSGVADVIANSDSTQPPTRHMVNLNGLHLSVLEAGTGDPVIFVHGVVTTSNIFPKYVGAYQPDFRGIAVDLRGYGDSDKPPTGFTI